MGTAKGKIPTAQLRTGHVVLYAAHPCGKYWIPSTGKERGTYAGTVTAIRIEFDQSGQSFRTRRWYMVTLTSTADPGGRTVEVCCAPAQTWWLASASRKWREFLGMNEGDLMIKSAIPGTAQ